MVNDRNGLFNNANDSQSAVDSLIQPPLKFSSRAFANAPESQSARSPSLAVPCQQISRFSSWRINGELASSRRHWLASGARIDRWSAYSINARRSSRKDGIFVHLASFATAATG